MTNQKLQSPRPDVLQSSVVEAILERWIRPLPPQRECRVAADRVGALSREVLDTMLTRQYRIAKLPSDEEDAALLARVTHWVARGKPISIRLGYGPMKNLNTTGYSRADWAEFFALCHLCAWHNKVQAVYPPGLRIKIVFDDSTIRMANRHDRRQMDQYISSVGRLIPALGFQSFIAGTMRQSSFAWLFHFGLYQWAGRRVRKWEKDPANQATIERMAHFARRNLLLPPGLSEEEQERACREASHRYRVYWEALQLSGLSKSSAHLVAMYLDGSQHHIRQPAALHLTTLGKGQVTQPWQGEGALCDNGHGKFVPIVLTASRREKLTTKEVGGLDLLPLEGFGSIQVCSEQGPSPSTVRERLAIGVAD